LADRCEVVSNRGHDAGSSPTWQRWNSSALADAAKNFLGSLALAGGTVSGGMKDFSGSSALTDGAREDLMAVACLTVAGVFVMAPLTMMISV
jgi:hypothetical protein